MVPRRRRVLITPPTTVVLRATTSIRPSPGSLRKNATGSPVAPLASRTERVWPVTAKNEGLPGVTGRRGKRGGTAAALDRAAGRPRGIRPARSSVVPQGGTPRDPASRPSPDFPAIEREVLAFWKKPTARSRRRSTSARARPSGSSTTARRSPTASRTTGTCSPATRRTSSRASRPCAATRCTAASAGTPTDSGRARGRAPARHHRQERDRGDGHRGLQPGRRATPCCATPRSGRTTSPARRAGSTSSTTTRRSTSPSWSR